MTSALAIVDKATAVKVTTFAEHLVATGKLTPSTLGRAQNGAAQSREQLIPILSKLGLLTERAIVAELSSYYGVPSLSKENFPTAPLFANKINKRFLQHHHVLPIKESNDGLVVAMVDPGDEASVKALGLFSGAPIVRSVAALTDIETAINKLYGSGEEPANLDTPSSSTDNEDVDKLADLASEAPVIRLVQSLITEAIQSSASDIHIEPFDDRVRIRFRIDGMLIDQEAQPRRLAAALTSRIKIMARLNIAERRLPQDGSIRFTVLGKDVDIRVSTSPTIYGESVVLRILDRENIALDFHALGFDDVVLTPTLELLHRPNGILLVTGPTGSGKTTTLYTALLTLNTPEKKILTIEDPIEYKLDGINQQEILPQINRTFASALRNFLRQDPDILMVGEIRDTETAQTAVQAALTGHLVLSTLHTNNAASAITRLLDMGIQDYLLASTITGVLGQRLLRKLCTDCRSPYTPQPDLADKIFTCDMPSQAKSLTLYRAIGCPTCHGSGYRGRTMIVELLPISEAIHRLILQKAGALDIQKQAVSEGMRTMYNHGLAKALSGETTIEEVLRVTQEA